MNKKQDITTTGMPLIDSVVERLCREDSLSTVWHRSGQGAPMPSLPVLSEILERLRAAIFPGYFGAATVRRESMRYHLAANYKLKVPVIPRIISEMAHGTTGIDIHPGAAIGEEFFIDHGTGVVIGETCIIGRNCRLYQGVTLGALSFPKNADGTLTKGNPRHPILCDNVTVYAGATILGRVTVGKGAVIGGNVWITQDVQAGARITQEKPRD